MPIDKLFNNFDSIMFSVTSSGYTLMLMWLLYYLIWVFSMNPATNMIDIFIFQPI